MVIEDKLPDRFKTVAFHPNLYVYAWKKKDLEKLFEELMQSNIAIKSGEAIIVEEDRSINRLIPLRSGEIELFSFEINLKEDEDWYDFVERSAKESLNLINFWNLEKLTRLDKNHSIWYQFNFIEDSLF